MLIHSERAPISEGVRMLLVGLTTVFFLFLLWSLTNGHPSKYGVAIGFLAVLWATVSFMTTRFEVTDEHVRADMWPFHTTIRFEELVHVGVTEKPIPYAIGYGLRLWGRTVFYRTCGQRGVVLSKKKKSILRLEKLVLTTEDPERFAFIVDQQRKVWNRVRRENR